MSVPDQTSALNNKRMKTDENLSTKDEQEKRRSDKLMHEAIRGIIKCSENLYKPTSPAAKPIVCRRAHSEPYSTTQSSFTRRKNKKGLSLTI